MNATKIFVAMLCAAMLWASVAFAQRSNPCDPRYHFITPSDCTSVAEQVGKNLGEMQKAIAEDSATIVEARRRFWETYPDKPGAAAARDAFGQKLYGKDVYYLWLTLQQAQGGLKVQGLEFLGGKLDGGIPRYASAEFADWVQEVKPNLGDKPLLKAMASSEKKHDVYLFERDWAEFDAVGREPVGLDDPALYFPALCIRWQKATSTAAGKSRFSLKIKADRTYSTH